MGASNSSWSRTAIVALAAAGLSVLATNAVVSAQSTSNVIHACSGARGELRMVSAGEPCASGESPVSWNVRGVSGASGARGPVGPVGPAGARGIKGKQGKVKLKLGGDIGTQLILGRLKSLDKKVVGNRKKINGLKAKLGDAAKLERRIYLRAYNNCIGIQQTYTQKPPDVALVRCKQGFYQGLPGYGPDLAAPGFQP